MARHLDASDPVDALEIVTRRCAKMLLAGATSEADDAFRVVDKVVAQVIATPEWLSTIPDGDKRFHEFKFSTYAEYIALAAGYGIKRRGGN